MWRGRDGRAAAGRLRCLGAAAAAGHPDADRRRTGGDHLGYLRPPWREGFVNVAIGVAGMEPLKDYRGAPDTEGHC